jgi:hypothetical protein
MWRIYKEDIILQFLRFPRDVTKLRKNCGHFQFKHFYAINKYVVKYEFKIRSLASLKKQGTEVPLTKILRELSKYLFSALNCNS